MSSPEQLVAPQANAVRDVIEPGTVYQMLVSLKEDAQTTTRVIATHCEELLDRNAANLLILVSAHLGLRLRRMLRLRGDLDVGFSAVKRFLVLLGAPDDDDGERSLCQDGTVYVAASTLMHGYRQLAG